VLESTAGRPQQEVARFQALTYWNHDAVQRALGWLPLAAEVSAAAAAAAGTAA